MANGKELVKLPKLTIYVNENGSLEITAVTRYSTSTWFNDDWLEFFDDVLDMDLEKTWIIKEAKYGA